MNPYIQKIKERIEPLRQEIIQHKLYSEIKTLEDVKIFMEFHVYAVWDFMSLLKSLQNALTCTTVPWMPKGDANTRYLINEIVVGEESDIDQHGNRKSHFELYLDAMRQCGCHMASIEQFCASVLDTGSLERAYHAALTPKEAQQFVNFTFEMIKTEKAHLLASIFTFGREDLIPGMFVSMIEEIHANFPEQISTFKYYLERHIEIDGDHHSHLALKMVENLCGNEENIWRECEEVIIRSMMVRIKPY